MSEPKHFPTTAAFMDHDCTVCEPCWEDWPCRGVLLEGISQHREEQLALGDGASPTDLRLWSLLEEDDRLKTRVQELEDAIRRLPHTISCYSRLRGVVDPYCTCPKALLPEQN